MPALSQPLLPVDFIRKVEADPVMVDFKSAVYENEAHKNRLAMRNWLRPMSPDSTISLSEPCCGFTREAERTFLHLAALQGDVLAVSELIGIGATADKLDTKGVSPLYLVLTQMNIVKSSVSVVGTADGIPLRGAERKRAVARLEWVAQILVEQHADVNRSLNNVPLLHLACRCESWGVISLLLKHGANPTSNSSDCLTSRPAKSRFSSMVKSIGTIKSRPPRVCPCWSGKIVSECHGKGQMPYPLSYMCVCGSGKSYQRCCSRSRNQTPVIEYWNEKSQRIIHEYDPVLKHPKCHRDIVRKLVELNNNYQELRDLLGVEPEPVDSIAVVKKYIEELAVLPGVDIAFAYALRRVNFVPHPFGRTQSRYIREQNQKSWNFFIDEYTSLGEDPRSREDIERTAKIGFWHGALIRVCEGIGCSKVEKRDIETLKLCSKCKIAVYCSAECQRSAWKSHKDICASEDQMGQCLPSQRIIMDYERAEMNKAMNSREMVESQMLVPRFLAAARQGLLQ